MKSNRKFKEKEQAVSAVIGVILMVAITVAIAATVYVYVSGMLSPKTATAPKFSWTRNLAGNSITITKGAIGYSYGVNGTPDRGNLQFVNETGIIFYVDSDLSLTASTVTLSYKTIAAGDKITGMVDGMTYTLIWSPTNEVIGIVTV